MDIYRKIIKSSNDFIAENIDNGNNCIKNIDDVHNDLVMYGNKISVKSITHISEFITGDAGYLLLTNKNSSIFTAVETRIIKEFVKYHSWKSLLKNPDSLIDWVNQGLHESVFKKFIDKAKDVADVAKEKIIKLWKSVESLAGSFEKAFIDLLNNRWEKVKDGVQENAKKTCEENRMVFR